MSMALWVAQGLLAVAFLAAGATKLWQPKEKLAQNNMAWVEDFSQGAIRLISAAEVLGALGLVLPALTGVLPWLTPLAALGLALLMTGAAYTHLRRKEGSAVVPPTVLLLLAALVAVGRFFVVPL
jgi:uncharacterized membrane protein YphA (DoxX/SURF4 family)